MSLAFPFSAIVGQDEMKLALTDRRRRSQHRRRAGLRRPRHRQVHRGARAGRAAAADAGRRRLPLRLRPRGRSGRACEDCRTRRAAGQELKSRLAPVPVVDLPLGATEDRVVGALDLERALAKGEKALRARPARARQSRLSLHRRGEPARGSPRRPAARRRRLGRERGRARGAQRAPSRPLRAGRQRQSGGGRTAPAACSTASASSVEVKTPTRYPDPHRGGPPPRRFRARPRGFHASAGRARTQALRRKITAARNRLAAIEVPDAVLERAARTVHGARHGRHCAAS